MRALLGVFGLVFALAMPSAASAVTVTFDDLPAGTVVTNQYADAGGPGMGVVFGPLPGGAGDGLDPKILAPGAGIPNSGTQVGDLYNCFGCEFFVPSTTGTFATLRSAVSMRVGLLGPPAAQCAADSMENSCSVTTLTAYDSAGMPIGSQSATLTQGAGVKTLLNVTGSSAAIAGFQVSQRTGSVDTNKDIAIDDLTFETAANVPPSPPDFSLTAAESFINIREGQTVTDAISIGRFNGSAGTVDFTLSGVPDGITASIAPDPAPGTAATLTFTGQPGAPPTGNTLPVVRVTGTPQSPQVGPAPRSFGVTLQIKRAFDVFRSGPDTVQLSPCQAQVPFQVNRDFSLTTPVDLDVTGGGAGITGVLSKAQATFPNGAGGETITLTATGDPTGRPLGPATFTVTGHSAGLPDRSASVTVSGTCPAGYDPRVTSMMITQGTQTTYLPSFADRPNGEFSYGNLPDVARMRQNAPTVVRVYANLASGPVEGVEGVPAVLYGGAFNRQGSPIALPGSPLLPVGGPRKLSVGPATPPNSELSSETEVYTFVLPASWSQQESIGVGVAMLPTQQTQQPQRSVAQCLTEACKANDGMRIRHIRLDPMRRRTIRPVRMKVNNNTLPDPQDVFAYTRLVYPPRLNVEPYYSTIDISSIANGTGTNREKDKKAASALGEWACDHSVPDDGWAVGIYTGVGNGLQTGIQCYAPPRATYYAVVEYKRPLSSSAHEFGHLLGLNHASPGCDADDEASPYDDWPPDEQGFTQSSGLDLRQGSGTTGPFAVMSEPSKNWFDAMSYCGDNNLVSNFLRAGSSNKWISVRYWNQVFDSFEDTSRAAPLQARATEPSLRVTGYGSGASAEISSVTPIRAGEAPTSNSPYHLLGLDAGGGTLVDVTMQENTQHVDGGDDELVLSGVIPSADVRAVAIARDGAIIARRDASGAAPTLSLRGTPRFKRGNATIRWTQDDADGDPLTTAISYAANGKRFERIWMGVGKSSATVPAQYLQRARSARIRVTVNDGFRTTDATSKPFRSPGAKPEVRILSPLRGARQPIDARLVLTGEAFDDTGARLGRKQLVWRAGKRVLGRGESVAPLGLPPGRRRITLTATDRFGRRGRASVVVRLRPATPVLLTARGPKSVGQKARRVKLRVAASIPARLTVRGQRFKVDRRVRRIRVKVRRGTKPLALTLRVAAGGRASVTRVRIKR